MDGGTANSRLATNSLSERYRAVKPCLSVGQTALLFIFITNIYSYTYIRLLTVRTVQEALKSSSI